MPSTHMQTVPETRWTVNRMAGVSLIGAWVLATVASFLVDPVMIDPTLSSRFLDMPLGAFLAGQGALIGLVIIGVRVSRNGRAHGDD